MMNVPFLDLPRQTESLRREIEPAIESLLRRCDFVGGEAVSRFEKSFAEFCGTRHCAGVSNGTDAIYLALKALGVGPGDEVITVPNTFIGTTAPITRAGARIRFVDVNPLTLNMDVSQIEKSISPKTKAVIPVHLYGQPADMEAVLRIARQHELVVIEDAAQAHGAKYMGKPVGGFGQAACFSFYPGKNLGAFGDAGAVVTDDPQIDEKIRILRDAGRLSKYEHAVEGYNHRMDTLQAAILEIKLRHLAAWNSRRRQIAARYRDHFSGQEKITTLLEPEGTEGVYHLFIVQVPERDRIRNWLQEAGIDTGIHYPIPLHLQPAYRYLGYREGDFPVAEAAARKIISLPIFPEMTDEQVDYVADHLIRAVRRI